jgi:hypothetical protein
LDGGNLKKPKNKKKPKVDLPHWNICENCANERGGQIPPRSCCTVSEGTCLYCNKENQTLTPLTDFVWANGEVEYIWD